MQWVHLAHGHDRRKSRAKPMQRYRVRPSGRQSIVAPLLDTARIA